MSNQEHHSSDPFIDGCFRHNSKEEILEAKEMALKRKWTVLKDNLSFVVLSGFIVSYGVKYMAKARSPAGPALRMLLAQKNPIFKRGLIFASLMSAGSLFAYVHLYNKYWAHAHNNPYSLGLIPNLDEQYGIKDISKFDGTI